MWKKLSTVNTVRVHCKCYLGVNRIKYFNVRVHSLSVWSAWPTVFSVLHFVACLVIAGAVTLCCVNVLSSSRCLPSRWLSSSSFSLFNSSICRGKDCWLSRPQHSPHCPRVRTNIVASPIHFHCLSSTLNYCGLLSSQISYPRQENILSSIEVLTYIYLLLDIETA